MKQYQFRPDADFVDRNVMVKVLLLALCKLPEADFRLALCLVPETYQNMSEIGVLRELHEHLLGADYKAFWSLVAENTSLVSIIPSFLTQAREYIIDSFAACYQVAPADVLASALNLTSSNSEFAACCRRATSPLTQAVKSSSPLVPTSKRVQTSSRRTCSSQSGRARQGAHCMIVAPLRHEVTNIYIHIYRRHDVISMLK